MKFYMLIVLAIIIATLVTMVHGSGLRAEGIDAIYFNSTSSAGQR